MKFTTSIEIARPVEEVFEYVSDATNGSAWDSAVMKVTKLSEGSERKGSTYRMVRKLPGGEAENVLEVVEFVPNHEFTIKTISGPTPLQYRYLFDTTTDGTRVTQECQSLSDHLGRDVGGLASILPDSILEPFVRRGVQANLETLKGILESSALRVRADVQ
jgi:uncharacterized protein YndB with AHSA1/START domain